MRIRKSTPAPPPSAPASRAPAAPGRRNRKVVVAAVVLGAVVVLGGGGWLLWRALRPDPLAPAREALDRRDFRTASDLLAERLADHPADADAHLLAAQAARRAGDFGRAAEHLRAYERNQGPRDAFDRESRLLKVHAGNVAEADALFQSRADQPDSDDTAAAMEAYVEGRLRTLAPRSDVQMDAAAAQAAGVAKLHRAVDAWLRIRTGAADRAQGLVWRGRVHLFENEHAKGVAELREALRLDPDHAEARWHLAMAVAQDAPAEAAGHLEALLARNPQSYNYRFALAGAYHMLGRLADARRLLEELRAGRPDDVAVLLELANLALDGGNPEAAGPPLARAVELAPGAAPVHLAAARYHQLAGRPADAERHRKRFEEIEAAREKK